MFAPVSEPGDAERTIFTGAPELGAERPRDGGLPHVSPAPGPAGPVDVDATLVDPRPPRGSVAPRSVGADDLTMEPATRRQPYVPPAVTKPPTQLEELRELGRELLKKNERTIWMLHTLYALGLGASVATLAQKGFESARWLTLSLGAAWLLVVLFFRFFGTGRTQDFITAWPGARRRFFVMSYLMKNLFQGMLFFLLPFYYASSSFSAKTQGVLYLLGGAAVLSTLDLVFDRVLLRFKLVASLFFAITLFGCANLVYPALVPDRSALSTLLVSAALSIGVFVLFHVPLETFKKPLALGAFASVIMLGVTGTYFGRQGFPPVPLTVADGGVGTGLREDGSLTVEVRAVREGTFDALYAVTDVSIVGRGDSFGHRWKKGGKVLAHGPAQVAPVKERGRVRVASRLPVGALPSDAVGRYSVDVITGDDQVVGRIEFEVKE